MELRLHRRRRLLIALLIGFIAVVCLGTGEAVLRVYVWWRGWTPNCYAGSLELFRPDEENGYDLRPGFRLKSGVFTIAVNSLGLRGPEIDRNKPAGVTRIAILGGSSAFGYFVSDGEEAARVLEHRLRDEGKRVEVINAGVPGYNLFQTTQRFEKHVAPLRPDVVVLYLGWNDLAYVVSAEPDARRFRTLPVAWGWERLLGRSVLYGFVVFRLLGEPVRLAPAALDHTRPTIEGKRRFRDNLNRLANLVESANALFVVCAQASAAHPQATPSLRDTLNSDAELAGETVLLGEWLHDAIRDFAMQRGAVFIDAYERIEPTETMLGDYIHLTAAGERELAELLDEHLAPTIR